MLGDTEGVKMARRARRSSRNRAKPLRSLPVVRFRPRPVAPFRGYDATIGKLADLEDRRRFHPMRALRPAFSLPRGASRLVVREPKRARALFPAQTRAVIAFANPRRVLICLRRKARREVLMALGKGGGGAKRPRRNEFSDVRC